ncbi:protein STRICTOSIDINE SYNTHASE-LIKE 10-like isoform X2 [Neltuma alba]|uniref:protein STRICTOSIDINE SYNTHASE-LIKE 10-like isoform X2 n=1 Tax=Neltuma alba TaxID=207710 RepID=UPI0010A519A7|nr:protein STRICTOSIDINE SYNTHASE-LIKE 10-like isoform X2 [Prosopis alba]
MTISLPTTGGLNTMLCFFFFFFFGVFRRLSSSSCLPLLVEDFIFMPLFPSWFEISSLCFLLSSLAGPESLSFDCNGEGPYAGVSDGRILKWEGTHKGWFEFAITSPHRDRKLCDGSTDPNKEPTCGRPLGLKFDRKTCNLYIADAYFGLLMVETNGGVAKQLAISADEVAVPFKFLNGLDVDEQTGVVYFSDSSTVYQRREGRMISLKGDKTGRLLKYDPNTKKVEILLQGLEFANGVALNKDGSFLLVAETDSGKIYKFWLKGSKTYTSELYAKLERPPDNIKRNKNGDFWVALYSNRTTSVQNANEAQKLGKDPVGVKLDMKRNILEILDGREGPELEFVSEVQEHHGRLWIGSSVNSYVAVIKVSLL